MTSFYQLQDILFFIRSLKHPIPSFNISNYVTFNFLIQGLQRSNYVTRFQVTQDVLTLIFIDFRDYGMLCQYLILH